MPPSKSPPWFSVKLVVWTYTVNGLTLKVQFANDEGPDVEQSCEIFTETVTEFKAA